MSEEGLKLAAAVVDKYSQPLREMQKALRRVADEAKGAHGQGAAQANKHEAALTALSKEAGRFEERIRTGVTPALAAVGVTVLSVAGAIEALKATTMGFAQATRQLTFLGRETGLTIQRLRELDALGRRIGVSPEAMHAAELSFAQHVQNLRRGTQAELNAFREGTNQAGNQAALAIATMPIDRALSQALGQLDKFKTAQDKKQWLRLWGLPENFADLPVSEIRRQMAEIHKSIGTLGPEALKGGLAFQEAIDKLADSVEKLKLSVGGTLAPVLTEVTDKIKQFVDANGESLAGTLRDLTTWMSSQDFKKFGADLKEAATGANEFAKQLGGWKTVAEGLVAIKLAKWVAEILIPLRAIANIGSPPAWVLGVLGAGAVAADVNRQKRGGGGLYGTDLMGFDPATGAPIELPKPRHARRWRPAIGGPSADKEKGGLGSLRDWLNRHAGDVPGTSEDGDLQALLHRESYTPEQTGTKRYGVGRNTIRVPDETAQLIKASYQPSQIAPPFAPAQAIGARDAKETITAGTKLGVLEALREWNVENEGDKTGAGGGYGGGPGSGPGFGGPKSGRVASPPGGLASLFPPGSAGGGAAPPGGRGAPASGGAVGPGIVPSGSGGKGRGAVASTVADAWRAAGMSEAGVAGILGNVQQESGFKPGLRHPDQPRWGGEAHFAHGLYQEGGAEWNKYAAWLQEHHPGADWRDLKLQSVFAAENLKKNYPGVWNRLKNARTAEEAAVIYSRGYEKPAAWAANEGGRAAAARRFFQNMPAPDLALHGKTLRDHFGYRGHGGELLKLGKQSGLVGGAGGGEIKGNASLHIKFDGLPRGARTTTKFDGLFSEVTLDRGRAMARATDSG